MEKGYNFVLERKDGVPTRILMDGKELHGVLEANINSSNVGEKSKDTITIIFSNIESFKTINL